MPPSVENNQETINSALNSEDLSKIYPSGQSTTEISVQADAAVVTSAKDDNQDSFKRILKTPKGVLTIGLIYILVSLYALLGPAELFASKNGHIALYHLSYLAPFQTIFIYHVVTVRIIFSNILLPLLSLFLGWKLISLSEGARLFIVVLSFLPLLGLSISLLFLVKGAHYQPGLSRFLMVAWVFIAVQIIYLTRPKVKAAFR